MDHRDLRPQARTQYALPVSYLSAPLMLEQKGLMYLAQRSD